jgi:UDP-2-acetamido-2-deoxy-ribo-hexuluronate aminotransferase
LLWRWIAYFTNDDNLARVKQQIRVYGQDRRHHHTSLGTNGKLDI